MLNHSRSPRDKILLAAAIGAMAGVVAGGALFIVIEVRAEELYFSMQVLNSPVLLVVSYLDKHLFPSLSSLCWTIVFVVFSGIYWATVASVVAQFKIKFRDPVHRAASILLVFVALVLVHAVSVVVFSKNYSFYPVH